MVTYPTMLNLSETEQIEDYNITSMQIDSCIDINVTPPLDICLWIESKGGSTNIAVFDIMALVSAYLGHADVGFPVTIEHIMGAVAYYLSHVDSGNSLTGCTFT
jgi:uncharacterized protein (DUF433 family)